METSNVSSASMDMRQTEFYRQIFADIQLVYLMHGIVMPIIIVVGLVGNAMTLWVLCQRSMRSAPTYLIQALTVIDMASLLYAIYSDVEPAITTYYQVKETFRNGPPPVFDYINIDSNDTSSNASNYDVMYDYSKDWNSDKSKVIRAGVENFVGCVLVSIGLMLTFAMAVERCITVLLPFKSGSIITRRRAKWATFFIFLVCVLAHLSQMLIKIIRAYTEPNNEAETAILRSIQTYYNRAFSLSSLMICVALLILNVVILRKIVEYKREVKHIRRSGSATKKQRNEMNIAMVIVIMIFFLLPFHTFMNILSFISGEMLDLNIDVLIRTAVVLRFIYVTNSSLNFIIYCVFGMKFRKVFIQTFFRSVVKKNNNNSKLNRSLMTKSSMSPPNFKRNLTIVHFAQSQKCKMSPV